MSNNYLSRNNNGNNKPNNFVDKISSRETSLLLSDEFSGLERICLTANGNLQRILSAWFNKPIKIEIIKNIPIDNIDNNDDNNTINDKLNNNIERNKYENNENNNNSNNHINNNSPILKRYEREVALVCENKVVCSAFSDVIVRDDKILNLIENEGVGLGQLFSYFNKSPSFRLLQVGRNDQIWWRVYNLEIKGVECEIKEVFSNNLFEK
ncbi:hypothetical protein Glove_227g69 [Diversispora epigaea]|uniref:Uncharacterized protein n=1 Tax=Diversispora epigaea TaxID=1348612 RepID=A0A397IEG8_9GLOM|nr:hypothetical protein Glove_227g69 [Diversispora epigaea]